MGNAPIIEVTDLSMSYDDFQAVKNVSFTVEPGQLYALLGTNGAGKTTTLEVLEGHRTPTSGQVRVFGDDPTDRAAVRPRVGIMLQESGFAPDLTVRETVRLIGTLTKRRDEVDRVLDTVDLGRKRNVKVAQLSGGEKRRLDFATAVYGDPELIFLDEPTTGLDIQARDALWDTIEQLRTQGTTILLTTHYLEEAQQHADRIALMHEGRIHTEGTLADLTGAFPATICFTLAPGHEPLPVPATIDAAGAVLIQTHTLQDDLRTLLNWATDHGHTLDKLTAGPSRLDDIFRTLGH